jgi:hypothetical protein
MTQSTFTRTREEVHPSSHALMRAVLVCSHITRRQFDEPHIAKMLVFQRQRNPRAEHDANTILSRGSE